MLRSVGVLLFASSILASCGQQLAFDPNSSMSSNATLEATFAPTKSLTPMPRAQPRTSFSVTAFLVASGGVGPLPFGASLRGADGRWIDSRLPENGQRPEFTFADVRPGKYQLWVLIPPEELETTNCFDIGLPDANWKLGKIVGQNQAVFVPGMTYREALHQAVKSSSPSAASSDFEFYAVLEDVDIRAGVQRAIDARLICKAG